MSREIAKRGEQGLEHYDPSLGLKSIEDAERAEKRWTRARDATRLLEAIELKLSEQRKFVLWWDEQEKEHGGRPRETRLRPLTGIQASDFALSRYTIHVWRRRLKVDAAYDRTLRAAQDKAIRVCEFRKGQTEQRGASGTNVNEWYTPKEYIEAARDVLGAIDLDPASSKHAQKWIQAAEYFTRADDGLQREWPGRVWLNPPYMQPDIALFVEKLCAEVEAGRTTEALLLTHNYTDTAWFHRAVGVGAAICFTRGRIAFLSADGDEAAPTQGQAFFYYGPNVDRFAERFGAIGFVVVPR